VFGSVVQPTFSVISSTTIMTTVPTGASVGAIEIETPNGAAFSSISFQVTGGLFDGVYTGGTFDVLTDANGNLENQFVNFTSVTIQETSVTSLAGNLNGTITTNGNFTGTVRGQFEGVAIPVTGTFIRGAGSVFLFTLTGAIEVGAGGLESITIGLAPVIAFPGTGHFDGDYYGSFDVTRRTASGTVQSAQGGGIAFTIDNGIVTGGGSLSGSVDPSGNFTGVYMDNQGVGASGQDIPVTGVVNLSGGQFNLTGVVNGETIAMTLTGNQ
jgi:hypothetical protein